MLSLENLLEQNRRELLDLSTRNRLLSMPVESKSARVVHVRDEHSDEIFRLLVTGKKTLTFIAGQPSARKLKVVATASDDDDEIELPPPDDDDSGVGGLAARHVDSKLQTALTPEGLQRRLLSLYRDARSIEEEQGVNILYLALGRLKWFEAEKSETPRYAPLILVPVALRRESVSDRFTLRWREEDVQENLSLAEMLRRDFGIELPSFPDEDNLVPSAYADAVRLVVSRNPNWIVETNGVTLGFYSFAKFLMYRDLDPDNWPTRGKLLESPFIGALLRDGFPAADSPFSAEGQLDEIIPATRLDHVVDADSSQTVAIERIRAGENLVIQGPPGTGKSQSIANIIATAVLDGKKVLFVAEKLAALEVVKRRLGAIGLGDLCLELHSHKAQKRAVLEEIGRTWELGCPRGEKLEEIVPQLSEARGRLNEHADALHTSIGPSGLSMFAVMGRLAELGERGKETAEFCFEGGETWTPDERGHRERLVAELMSRVSEMGEPCTHSWRGVRRQAVLAIDLPGIEKLLRRCRARVESLREACASLAGSLSLPEPEDFSHAELHRRTGEHLAVSPPLDAEAQTNRVWQTSLTGIAEIVEAGKAFSDAKSTLAGRVNEVAWDTELAGARTAIAEQAKSAFSFLPDWMVMASDYSRALRTLASIVTGELPTAHCDRIALLDAILAGQRARKAVTTGDDIGRRAFGVMWRGENSDWSQLSAIVVWVRAEAELGLGADVREIRARISSPEKLAPVASRVAESLYGAWESVGEVINELALDVAGAFGGATRETVPLTDLRLRLDAWLGGLEELSRWCAYEACAARARELALAPLIGALESGEIAKDSLQDVFIRAQLSQLLREAVRLRPELARFDGVRHNQAIEHFRKLDRERLLLSRYRVLAAHHNTLPNRSSGIGATGIVLGEMKKKRNHRPVRRLIADAGTVVQAVKPVFMMSPLSVAQFLAPGAVEFDLLVVDEASQVQPVDALGAMARAKQIVVVGDIRQLPPTRFFARLTSDEPDLESDDEQLQVAQAKEVESILGLCCARGLRETMLRWHYRSRHHSLIAVSNREFYDSKLFIVPSPHLSSDSLGLRFTKVPGGVFDSGGTGTNRVEARAVCAAVLAHALQHPQLSLGVAAFSVRQQQAIQDELELLRRANLDTEDFFHAHPHEPFFVKNLENVQGDERDVIFISVGYGPNASGYMAMRFGPLSSEGGERRLNVLISRAKRRCEVFASFTADAIDLERAGGAGVRSLKVFLQFAETGRLAVAEPSGGEEQSPFEEAVRRAVQSLGYEVHPQVGIAGFFIDLGVVDPAQPGRYLIGIECDGAAYHSSRSARDRDRLRQAVLEDHGWHIHRIWSTDWFQRPTDQLRKVAAALEVAKGRRAEKTPAIASVEATPVIERETNRGAEDSDDGEIRIPYVEADFAPGGALAPHEVSAAQMADILSRIVEIESPIHEDELVARVRDLWGLGRAGVRIQESVQRGIDALLQRSMFIREEGCVLATGNSVMIRNRENTHSASLRKPEMLPPHEIRAALLQIVEEYHAVGERQLVSAAARVFGYKATGATLKQRIIEQLQKLNGDGKLRQENGFYKIPNP